MRDFITSKIMLLIMLAAMLPLAAGAYDFMLDGLCYNINDDGVTVTVTWEVQDTPSYNDLGEWGETVLSIPETVTYDNNTYTVTAIGENAFAWCECLCSVEFPNTLTTIGKSAFFHCSNLSSLDLPNSVTTIDDEAFSWCEWLYSVNFPNSLIYIGDNAFDHCTGLYSIEIPDSVTTIGSGAFNECLGLRSITIGKGVTSIGGGFYGCHNLGTIVVSGSNPVYDSRNDCNAIIRTADNNLLYGCCSTYIPTSVTAIGEGAFAVLESVEEIPIPSSVTTIGKWAFSECTGLTALTIPNSVTTIGSSIFYGCTSLTEIHSLIRNVKAINCNNNAFNGVTASCSLYVPKGTEGDYATTVPWSYFYNIEEEYHGDVDGDGVVTSADVTALYNIMLSGEDNPAADVDGDGYVTAGDITVIYNIMLGSE